MCFFFSLVRICGKRGKWGFGKGGGNVHTLLRLSNRRVYSSRISCSRGVKRGDEDLDGLLGLLVDIVGSDWLSLVIGEIVMRCVRLRVHVGV